MALIDTDTLCGYAITRDKMHILPDLLELIEQIPEVDAVEVTRCHDCIAWNKDKQCTFCGKHSNGYCERGTTHEEIKNHEWKTGI